MNTAHALFQKAFGDHREGKIADAEAGYRKVLSLAPEHPSALHLLGLIEFDRKNFQAAVPLVKRSLRLVPNDIQWLCNYAVMTDNIGDYGQSVSTYEKVLALDPQHSNALLGLGNGYYEIGDFTKALNTYSSVVKNEPNNIFGKLRYRGSLAQVKKQCTEKMSVPDPSQHQESLPIAAENALRSSAPGERILPTADVNTVAETGIMVQSLYQLGYRQCAAWYAIKGFRLIKEGTPGDVPERLLKYWRAPNRESLFAAMLVTLVVHCGSFASVVGDYEEALNWWCVYDPENPEPFIRLGLLKILDAAKNNRPPVRFFLDLLDHAHCLMNNERSAALLAVTKHQCGDELAVPYDGTKLFVYPQIENLTTYCLLEQGDWFEQDMVLYRALVRPGDRVLDLGANVGVYTISAAQRVGSQGRVVAVEPARSTFELLSKSAAGFPMVAPLNVAVGEQSGWGNMAFDNNGPEMNRVILNQENSEAVEITTVDALAERLGIDAFDIIKIDVEGSEFNMLKGARNIIGEKAPIIFYEFSEAGVGLADAFAEMGYQSYLYSNPARSLKRFHKGDELDMFQLNMIAAKPESLPRLAEVVTIEE
ncbi:MAG TPA: FkbM family methyltransferase [Thermodesulfobacteriota bacterium]|nr:FkbM family methyltransferase [Thermodesulfobacteriota bacterium]